MSDTADQQWIRLGDGERFMGGICPAWNTRQRRKALAEVLFARQVPKLARLHGASPPEKRIEELLAGARRRNVKIDISNGRIVLSGFLIRPDLPVLPHWPGGPPRVPQPELRKWELQEVRFDQDAALAYVAESLLPKETPGSTTAAEVRALAGLKKLFEDDPDCRLSKQECRSQLGHSLGPRAFDRVWRRATESFPARRNAGRKRRPLA